MVSLFIVISIGLLVLGGYVTLLVVRGHHMTLLVVTAGQHFQEDCYLPGTAVISVMWWTDERVVRTLKAPRERERERGGRGREGERERGREGERERGREGERERVREWETERRRDGETERRRDGETERRRDGETERQSHLPSSAVSVNPRSNEVTIKWSFLEIVIFYWKTQYLISKIIYP